MEDPDQQEHTQTTINTAQQPQMIGSPMMPMQQQQMMMQQPWMQDPNMMLPGSVPMQQPGMMAQQPMGMMQTPMMMAPPVETDQNASNDNIELTEKQKQYWTSNNDEKESPRTLEES